MCREIRVDVLMVVVACVYDSWSHLVVYSIWANRGGSFAGRWRGSMDEGEAACESNTGSWEEGAPMDAWHRLANSSHINLTPSHTKYFHHINRELAKERQDLYNRVASIVQDAAFVERMRERYNGLPVLANLRCGGWYVESPDDSCYFKSTDGHHGNWSFSVTRLNLNVVQWVGRKGGCIIVDATRKGKKFPDAMNRTIPMWATVLNRATARLFNRDNWDTSLHMPLWIGNSEKAQIEERIGGWLESLLAMDIDLKSVLRGIEKPLRPLWLCPASRVLGDEVVDVGALPFCPIVLVSASREQAGERRTSCTDDGQGWPYVYVPGAGDDEESWACGLTPQLLWEHRKELIRSGPDGIYEKTKELMQSANGSTTQFRNSSQVVNIPKSLGNVETDAHHKLPEGWEDAESGSTNSIGSGGGMYFIGDTGVAIGDLSSCDHPKFWDNVDAVLNCGCMQHSRFCNGSAQGKVYQWHRVQNSKKDRTSLRRAMPDALAFVSEQLDKGKKVLIHDDDGLDSSVCMVVALLLACFTKGHLSQGESPLFHHRLSMGEGNCAVAAYRIEKEDVKKMLIFVSRHYSQGRPTRGMLKQVFNFFRPEFVRKLE